MADDRVFSLQGVHNFRDYGGYAVKGGGRVKPAVLWRSGQHHDATDADLERIERLGLTRVFDLRTSKERVLFPCRRPAGFSGVVHVVSDGAAQAAPHMAAAQRPRRDVESIHESMRRSYANIGYRPVLNQLIRRMLADLAAQDGPSLVNCLAGKDRTGIAVVAVQQALGVHHDDILEDYLLTNTAGDVEARIAAGYRRVASLVGELGAAEQRAMMGVDRSYLEVAFDAMRERNGSIDGWLEQELGVDAAMREQLRARFVV